MTVLTIHLWEILNLKLDAVTGWGIGRCARRKMAINSLVFLALRGRFIHLPSILADVRMFLTNRIWQK